MKHVPAYLPRPLRAAGRHIPLLLAAGLLCGCQPGAGDGAGPALEPVGRQAVILVHPAGRSGEWPESGPLATATRPAGLDREPAERMRICVTPDGIALLERFDRDGRVVFRTTE